MTNEFPKMLYKWGGIHVCDFKPFHLMVVDDQEGQDKAVEDGWCLTMPEAESSHNAAVAMAASGMKAEDPDSTQAPTRAELEAMAVSKGIRFSASTTDKELTELINKALK